MKKLMGRDPRQVFIRISTNCRGIRMLHPTSARAFAEVQNKRVVLERCALHKLQFIFANAPKIFFDAFLTPVVPMNHNAYLRIEPAQLKFLEFADLYGSIRKHVVVWGHEEKCPRAAHRFASASGSACRPPV